MKMKNSYREHWSDCPLRVGPGRGNHKVLGNPLKASKDLFAFTGDLHRAPEWHEISLVEFIQRADCILDKLHADWDSLDASARAAVILAATVLFQLQETYAGQFKHPPFHQMWPSPDRSRLTNEVFARCSKNKAQKNSCVQTTPNVLLARRAKKQAQTVLLDAKKVMRIEKQ